MTTLILAFRKPFSWYVSVEPKLIFSWFAEINRQGLVTFFLTGTIITLFIIYFTALFLTFDLGFKIRKEEIQLQKLKIVAADLQLKLQENEKNLFQENQEVLAAMEKISYIKYLGPENIAVSLPQSPY